MTNLMMKKLKTWQKAGLITALVGGLTLGGCTVKNNSGLEGKLPTVTTNTANAMEVNPQGYEVPDLTGRTPKSVDYKKDSEGLIQKGEIFLNVNGQGVIRLSRNGNIFGYIIDKEQDGKLDYGIIDNNGDGIFESKYDIKESYPTPDWVR